MDGIFVPSARQSGDSAGDCGVGGHRRFAFGFEEAIMMRKIRSGFLFGGIAFAVTLSAFAASGEFTRLKFNTPGTTFLKGVLEPGR